MNFKTSLIALAAMTTMSTAAMADIVNFGGDTTGAASFNRLVEDLSALSATGTAVAYEAFSFTVDTSGSYTFLSTADFDNFVFLYAGNFNASQPLTGALKANDDLMTATTSGFAYALTAGNTYTFITTGFANADFGAYANTIGGPGLISAVPEPAVWLSMAIGLFGVAAATRRRHA